MISLFDFHQAGVYSVPFVFTNTWSYVCVCICDVVRRVEARDQRQSIDISVSVSIPSIVHPTTLRASNPVFKSPTGGHLSQAESQQTMSYIIPTIWVCVLLRINNTLYPREELKRLEKQRQTMSESWLLSGFPSNSQYFTRYSVDFSGFQWILQYSKSYTEFSQPLFRALPHRLQWGQLTNPLLTNYLLLSITRVYLLSSISEWEWCDVNISLLY